MSNISQIIVEGTTYDIKDAEARQAIANLETYSDYLGVTTSELSDGATTNPITINGESKTAVKGNIANYGSKEFIFNGSAWQEFGDMSAIGALGYKDDATGSFTPAGTVSSPNATVTPTTTTVNSITAVGTLPTMSVSGEVLTLSPGTLPTKGSDTTVMTGASVDVDQPTFTGTQGSVTVS